MIYVGRFVLGSFGFVLFFGKFIYMGRGQLLFGFTVGDVSNVSDPHSSLQCLVTLFS